MSEVTFKVHADAGGHRHADPARAAGRDRHRGAVRRPWRTPFEVSGAVHLQPALVARLWHEGLRGQGQAVTALRLENFAKSVAYRKRQAQGAPQGLRRDPRARPREFACASGASCASSRCCRAAMRRCGASRPRRAPGPRWSPPSPRYMECRAFYDWSGGLVWARGAADDRCRRRRHPPRHRHARRACHADPGRAAGACRRRGVPAAGGRPASGSRASSRRPSIRPASSIPAACTPISESTAGQRHADQLHAPSS